MRHFVEYAMRVGHATRLGVHGQESGLKEDEGLKAESDDELMGLDSFSVGACSESTKQSVAVDICSCRRPTTKKKPHLEQRMVQLLSCGISRNSTMREFYS